MFTDDKPIHVGIDDFSFNQLTGFFLLGNEKFDRFFVFLKIKIN